MRVEYMFLSRFLDESNLMRELNRLAEKDWLLKAVTPNGDVILERFRRDYPEPLHVPGQCSTSTPVHGCASWGRSGDGCYHCWCGNTYRESKAMIQHLTEVLNGPR